MSDQQGWEPSPRPPWEQAQQPYGAPQQYPGQPPQPRSHRRATSPSSYQQQPPPGYQQQSPGYGYQPPQQGYPSGPPVGHQTPRPPKKRHTVRNVLLGAVGGIVLIIVIAAVASSQNNNVSKDSSPPATKTATKHSSTSSPSQTQNNTTGPVGTTFTVNETNQNGATVKYSITLDRVIQHAAPDNSFDTPPAGDHLAAAEFTIRGLVGDDQDSADNDAAAVGTNSQTYQTGLEGVAAGTDFNDGQFNTSPGSVSIGWESFEVKDGVHVASIQWSPGSSMDGDTVTWTLNG
jgi:hypothetical protein